MQGLSPGRCVDRLRLREAGVRCDGSMRDEALVDAISDHLLGPLKWRPQLLKRSKRKREADGVEVSLSVHRLRHKREQNLASSCRSSSPADIEFGAYAIGSRDGRRQLRCSEHSMAAPKNLLDRDSAAQLWSHVRGDGQVHPLPRFVEDKRTLAKNRAGSSLREALDAWLRSERAQVWRSSREDLWDRDR